MSRKTVLILLTVCLFSSEKTADELMNAMLSVMTPENSHAVIVQKIQTTSGNERTLEYEYYTAGKGADVLMRYTKPNQIKGNAFLMKNNGDDIWLYSPRTRRVRKLASHARKQKVQGSDFSYEDFSGGDSWKEDFTVEKLPDQEEQYVLAFYPRPDVVTSYSKMITFIRYNDYYPVKIDYYDKNGVLMKSLYLEDIRTIDGYPTAMKMRMLNHLTGSETVMETLRVEYDLEFPENFFTRENLRK